MKDLALWLGLLSAPAIISLIFGPPGFEAFREGPRHETAPVATYEAGRAEYALFCAGCHGRVGEGTARAPGLHVSRPGTDPAAAAAFHRVVRGGVVADGRQSGMPLFGGMSPERIDAIISYLRRVGRTGDGG